MEQGLRDRAPEPEKVPVVLEQVKTKRVATGQRAGEPVKAPPKTQETAADENESLCLRVLVAKSFS